MIKTITFFLLLFLPVFSFSQGDSLFYNTRSKKDTLILNHYVDSLGNAIVDYSLTFLKSPYRYGGRTKRGFDCSGFVSKVYQNFGITLPHSSKGMFSSGQPIELQDIRKGDLLLFKNTTRRRKGIGHVGIVTEVKEGDVVFIHSATHQGVRFDNLSAPYYTKHYFKAIRLPVMDSLKNK
jgi:cell wall-associated NlpC family hydrolase